MLKTTQSQESNAFWNARPCGGSSTFSERATVRYTRDPWLPSQLQIVAQTNDIVEVGCGQGTDALSICKLMSPQGRYRAFDPSQESLSSAKAALSELAKDLKAWPEFIQADALALPVEDNSVASVYSCGVIHHIDRTEAALDEIRRILRPGGTAFIAIYRTASPKVAGAHALRGFQCLLDRTTGRERSVLRALERFGWDMPDGTTMVRECFGVPILKSYTRSGVERLFSRFDIASIQPHGYLWMITATKPRA
jgi:SAM-dependent methyltransferase